MTLPLDPARVQRLFEFIVKGLAFHHWQVYLATGDTLFAGMLTEAGAALFEGLLARGCRDRVKRDCGQGTFVYEGCQAKDSARLTIWRMSLYGMVLAGDGEADGEAARHLYGMTAPRHMAVGRDLAASLRGEAV